MLRSGALRFTAEGRLLRFDTGDWSMLLGGFLGRISGFDGLIVRARSSSVDEVVRTAG
jgi:hypothetical protein